MSTAERNRLIFIANLVFARRLYDSRRPSKGVAEISGLIEIVQEFERDGFDALFASDFLGLNRDKLAKNPVFPCEPLTFLAAVAASTKQIGLVGTGSTMFEYPYNLARQFASLDHISGGRAGWNAVTSFNGERNYGLETIPPPEERYEIAAEFIDVAKALWRSWRPGSVITDRADPRHTDSAQIVDIRHRGRHFGVEEALDIPPSPQGRPVILQAGASEAGIAFAGRHAEAVFVAAPTIEHGKTFYRAVKDAAIKEGRDPNSVKILPGLHTFIADTQEEAEAQHRVEATPESIARIRTKLAYEFPEFDLTGLDPDKPIPLERIPDLDKVDATARRRSRIALVAEIATRPNTTFGDFIQSLSRSYAHLVLVGTPESVADEIERWFVEDAADGFIFLGSEDSYEPFVRGVLPRLREKGVWTPSADGTLREKLGVGDTID